MKSILTNFLYNILLLASSMLFPIIVFMHVSRVIGPEGLGMVAFSQALSGYFGLFAGFGVLTYGVRETARARGSSTELAKTVWGTFWATTATTTIALLAYALFVLLYPPARAHPSLYVINACGILLSLLSFEWAFQGLEEYRYIALRSIAVKLVSVAAILVFVRASGDYLVYAALTVAGLGANSIFNIGRLLRRMQPVLRGTMWRARLRAMLPFALISVATSLYMGMDKLLLGALSGDAAVGLYSPAEKMVRLALSLVAALSAVLYPRVSSLFAEKDGAGIQVLVSRSFHAMSALAIPIFVGIELLAPSLILALSGEGYIAAIPVLRIEAAIIVPVTLSSLAGIQILVGSGAERQYFIAILAGAAAFAIFGFLCIPAMGAPGAAIAIFCAEFIGALVATRFASQIPGCAIPWRLVVKPAVASGLMAIPVALLTRTTLHPLVLVLIAGLLGSLVYLVALLLLGDSLARDLVLRLKSKILKFKLSADARNHKDQGSPRSGAA